MHTQNDHDLDQAVGDTGADAARRVGATSPRPSLRGTGFGALWVSAGAANLGDGILLAGLPVLATTITDSPAQIAGVTLAVMLPMVLTALPAGALADRADRRRVLFHGNLWRGVGLLALVAVVAVVDVRLALVYAAAVLTGGSEILVDTTSQSAVPGLVPRQRLDGANARMIATQRVGNDAVGAPIGAILATLGAGLLYGVPAGLYALAALAALRLRHRRVAAAARSAGVLETTRRDVVEGLRHLMGEVVLRRLAAVACLSNLGSTAFFAVFVVYVIGPLGLPAAAYGGFLVAVAIGGLLGSVVAERVLARLGGATGMRCGFATLTAMFVVLGVTSDPAVVAVAIAVMGAGGMVINVAARSLRQSTVPDRLLGRVTASMAAVALAATPLGAIVGGVVAEWVGVRATVGVAAALNVVALLLLAPVTTAAVDAARARAAADRPHGVLA